MNGSRPPGEKIEQFVPASASVWQLGGGCVPKGIVPTIESSPLPVIVSRELKAGPHRPLSRTAGIPGQTNAGFPEHSGVIFKERRRADLRIRFDDPVRIVHVIGSVSVGLIPSARHLLPHAETQSEIRFELDFILDI